MEDLESYNANATPEELKKVLLMWPNSQSTVVELRSFIKEVLKIEPPEKKSSWDHVNGAGIRKAIDDWKTINFLQVDEVDRASAAQVRKMLAIFEIGIAVGQQTKAEQLATEKAVDDIFWGSYMDTFHKGEAPTWQHLCGKETKRKCALKYLLFRSTQLEYAFQIQKDPYIARNRILSCMELLIPCVLHFELRVGECLFKRLFQAMMSMAPTVAKANQYKETADDLINQILSSGKNFSVDQIANPLPTSSDYAITSEGKEIKHVKISAVRQRLLMSHVDSIIDEVVFSDANLDAIVDEAQKNKAIADKKKFKELFQLYKQVGQYLRYRNDLQPLQIDQFQTVGDKFCDKFVEMFGAKSITNYIHDLRAGHLRFFFRRYGNLYRHSNVGFESFVGTVRSLILKRGKSGGYSGEGKIFTCADQVKGYMLRSHAMKFASMHGEVEVEMTAHELNGKYIREQKARDKPAVAQFKVNDVVVFRDSRTKATIISTHVSAVVQDVLPIEPLIDGDKMTYQYNLMWTMANGGTQEQKNVGERKIKSLKRVKAGEHRNIVDSSFMVG